MADRGLDKLLRLAGLGKTTTAPQSSMLPPSATAPGAKGLHDNQLQSGKAPTQAPEPPLPPKVDLPNPDDVRSFAGQVLQVADSPHLQGAAKFLLQAATALSNNTPIEALARFRSAQTSIHAAHLDFNAGLLPVANVFSAKLAPAEQSSARAEMYQTVQVRNAFRGLEAKVATYIEQVRRWYYHGSFPPGYPSGWSSLGVQA